jgi:hypothetical protein
MKVIKKTKEFLMSLILVAILYVLIIMMFILNSEVSVF